VTGVQTCALPISLSRGAADATFVDRSRLACSVIRDNLASLGIDNKATILCRDAVAATRSLASEGVRFDLIFFDPPYASPSYGSVLKQIATEHLLADDGILVVEHRATAPLAAEFGDLSAYREVKQGESALTFMRWNAAPYNVGTSQS